MTDIAPGTKIVDLPPPQFPMLTRMISNSLFPENGREDPITWAVGEPHPLASGVKVIRMFVDRGGVEVYSVSSDGKAAVRNLIPMSWIRLIEEAMPLDVFVEELAAAEAGDDDDPDDPPPDPDLDEVPAAANGQAVTS